MTQKKPSLHFVKVINFELTYNCNMSCSHCVQHDIRNQGNLSWITTESVIKCLAAGKSVGFTRTGVNFTGGEPFLRGSNLPLLIRATKEMNLNVRVNTNGWWGNEKGIIIGDEEFSDAHQVVAWLISNKVSMLALSFDKRYETNSKLLGSVLNVMHECELQGLYYQVIHTQSSNDKRSDLTEKLGKYEKLKFNYMIPVGMEMVDLGAASSMKEISSYSETYCDGKGFYRPSILHIDPNGGVRTCMYATGQGWLGNINNESLGSIIENFKKNPVVDFFRSSSSAKRHFIEAMYLNQDTHLPKHPCSLAVRIAKFINQ